MSSSRVVLVTGGSGAVGRQVCAKFAQLGYDIAFTYCSNELARDAVLSEVAALGRRVTSASVDLASVSMVAEFVQEVVHDLGGLDALVHAAGPYPPQRYLGSVQPDLFHRHVEQELSAFFNIVSPCLPHLRKRQGSVTAVTTFAVRKFPLRDGLSAAPKAGVEGVVRALAAEEGKYGVRANSVGPGILTDGLAVALHERGDFDDDVREQVKRSIPMKRFGMAAEVAEAVVFLGSDRASYISGQSLDVDGGYGV
jgi:3-oxoacyl-[acyl-carrier protein] reductase